MPVIRQLPNSVINKIAAGEVIERPASAVKELLENAVDAGATRIEVAVVRGGCDRVRVTDNGCGIEPEQLLLAVDPHATSKIESADDLFSVHTLGFRGEALASIAEVSRFRLRSRVAGRPDGAQLEVVGGQRSPVSPVAASVGTTVEVEDLFFNTPVRRKFLKAVPTEFAHVSEAFTRIALPYPQLGFTLLHQGRVVHELPPVTDWRQRILALFGQEFADALIWVDNQDQDVRLSGYVVDPVHSRGHNKLQYLFLNGRYIRDRALQHALGEAYRGLLLQGRHPIAFLRMEMPPEVVDVNVHPCKLEVRFQDGGRLYSQLLGTLRTRFLSADLTARVHAAQRELAGTHGPRTVPPAVPASPAVARPEFVGESAVPTDGPTDGPLDGPLAGRPLFPVAELPAERLEDWPPPGLTSHERTESPLVTGLPRGLPQEWESQAQGPRPAGPLARLDDATPGASGQGTSASPHDADRPADPSTTPPGLGAAAVPGAQGSPAAHRPVALQTHNRYLVTEGPQGLEVIDQHALHERILYEQLRRKLDTGQLERQRLLVPEMVTLVPTEASAVLEHRQLLADLGLEVEDFGGGTVTVSSYPALLGSVPPGDLLRQVAEQLAAGIKLPDRRDLLDRVIATMACKAAVKAGDRLSEQEIAALIERRHAVQDSHHCPHGRPTTLVFSREELDRRFKRI